MQRWGCVWPDAVAGWRGSESSDYATDVMCLLQADELLSPFLEPLVRSFVLGMTAACALETGHVATQVRASTCCCAHCCVPCPLPAGRCVAPASSSNFVVSSDCSASSSNRGHGGHLRCLQLHLAAQTSECR